MFVYFFNVNIFYTNAVIKSRLNLRLPDARAHRSHTARAIHITS